ncbi:MAG: diadenylate cyclase CdaA [Bacilli bacterium]|nr:diadenylate cyclase CdaA [Bacilli bacterium]MDY0063795.1 diadenylate cyclase CdaA [Bacilli bacterium]
MEFINDLIHWLEEYTNFYDMWTMIFIGIDLILTLVIVLLVYRMIKVRIQKRKIFLIVLLLGIFYALISIFQLHITQGLVHYLLFWVIGILIIVFQQEIKHGVESAFYSTRNENLFSSEEERLQVIRVLIQSAQYLSKRKIGALITIEREDNLNTFIDKAILIKAVVSEELLTTLFTVGTPTHDGAVIIRKNRIMCAGAYLPSTDKYDVPKSLGTRHRAAIGLSERYDAITIVVSEETGNISITADGNIEVGLSEDKLHELLERYLIVK